MQHRSSFFAVILKEKKISKNHATLVMLLTILTLKLFSAYHFLHTLIEPAEYCLQECTPKTQPKHLQLLKAEQKSLRCKK